MSTTRSDPDLGIAPSGAISPKRVLVLGLGNPILRDDGVGWRVVEETARRLTGRADLPSHAAGVELDCSPLGGLALMERLVGWKSAVLVDAICTAGGEPGAVYNLNLDDLPTLHANGIHDASLKAALALGRQLGATLPEQIAIVAIEAQDLYDFGEGLTPEVAAGVPAAVAAVLDAVALLAHSIEPTSQSREE